MRKEGSNYEFDFSYEISHLLHGGKLYKDWRNVYSHQSTQLGASIVFGSLLDLPSDEQMQFSKVALVHDWRKRLDIKPDDFSYEEKDNAEREIAWINPDQSLMTATGVQFIIDVAQGMKPTVLQMAQFYVDEICKGSEIVSVDDRIDEVSARRQDLNQDVELRKQLNGRAYWDVERSIAHDIEVELWKIMVKNGYKDRIKKPSEISTFIRNKLPKHRFHFVNK